MKKQVLNFVLVAAVIGSIVSGCSSQKNASEGDTTKMKDTTKMSAPAAAPDTAKKDTAMKKDTTRH
jgi:hypothetical protein